MQLTEEVFESRTLASKAAAVRIRDALARDLAAQDDTAMIVSGGATPEECYAWLSNTYLAWERIHILLSDERCVEASDPASNEGMIRSSLLTNHATGGKLLSVFEEGLSPTEQCLALSQQIRKLPLPFSISLLGMGEDGHFASLFPGFDRLEEGLDPDSAIRCMPIKTAASPHPRITLTMSTITQSQEILLLFFGIAKRDVFEQAKLPDSMYPVSALLHQDRTPVHIIWAP
ncbi:MAG: 6-phosphogluconolactonase [Gammaproteobacteria bacterium]|nr:MAG: 6-phosphogluconolactonase [Gammaproteobacteria bacterium]